MNDSQKDPVCGMVVSPETNLPLIFEGKTIYFCSDYCRDKFQQHPKRYRVTAAPADDGAKESKRIAYFTMEIALDRNIPTYSGGLGVLAGDMLRACADLNVPVVGVSLLWRKGYFEQSIDSQGLQHERPVHFEPGKLLRLLPVRVEISIEGRVVRVGAWQYDVGDVGSTVPVILLDTDLDENSEYDRSLTAWLYGGGRDYRLAQEAVLGIGGVRMLRALGYCGVQRFHMNEGHASLIVFELMNWQGGSAPADWDFEDARQRCIFTTHTPVPAGHDQFDWASVERIIAAPDVSLEVLRMLGGRDRLNMTLLGLNLSRYVNGVAQRHEEVSREMFPGYPIHHITNGVHSATWTCESFQRLYDEYIPDWRKDPAMLRKALSIPNEKISAAHEDAKNRLFAFVKEKTGHTLAGEALTIGFARRATAYKRAGLVLSDPARLVQIARTAGPLQFVFAGKAHPQDEGGKREIQHIIAVGREIGQEIPIVYLENYDLEMAKLLVSGVDLWLNTPERPMEASGTSGMKAAHNGVPSFSTLDGWWIEGHIEGVTGWSIGACGEATPEKDAPDLLRKLDEVILPAFYRNREQWMNVMRHAIALNASYFNTHRMVQQYVTNAYLG